MYSIKEIFYTVQGEGYHAGIPAVFVRFSGCNLWSGREKDRERDASRNAVECPRWCDTDFADGSKMAAQAIVISAINAVETACDGSVRLPLVVFTGGEPLLQLDRALVSAFREAFPFAELAVETNGTVHPKVPVGDRDGLDWVCVSPKVPAALLALTSGSELKVVVPAYDPSEYAAVADRFTHCYVSAEAETFEVGKSLIVSDNLQRAAAWCMQNPRWKVTVQTHKIIGVP